MDVESYLRTCYETVVLIEPPSRGSEGLVDVEH
jgi:hypothetical protein